MHAIRFHAHGGPEQLRYEEVPDPVPGPGEALVRVRACALNHLDLWQRRGLPRVTIPLPHISGSDVAGELAAGAADLAPGTRVLVQPGLSCGRCAACLAGDDNLCPSYDIVGYRSDGGYAELLTVPAANLIPIPDHIGFEAAAAFPLTFLTAWHMLVTRARLRAGEDVLVLAAGSGVGQAAIQLANALGARTFATAGTDEKRERAFHQLGAASVVDHYAPDWADTVRQLTGGRGVDVVVEHVGEATWPQSLRALARGGRLVTCGATTGPNGALDLRALFARHVSVLGSYMGSKGELWHVARLFFEGRVAPIVDSVYPLAAAADAQRYLEERRQFGKIVLEC